MTTKIKPTKVFWIIGVLALFWFIVGVIVFFSQTYASDVLANAVPDVQTEFVMDKPLWVNITYAIYVWCGLFGSIFLLAQKKIAYFFFVISFIGAIIRMAYNVITINIIDVYGKVGIALVIVTLFVTVFLMIFSKKAKKVGILK
jgi:hypothetical protein